MAAHLLPYDPVAKKRSANTKRPHSLMSDVEGTTATVAEADVKAGTSKTGVHLRWHTKSEYAKLSSSQKKELYEWRIANPDQAKPPEDHQGILKGKEKDKLYTKKQLLSLVSKKIKFALDEESEEKKGQDDDAAYIMSLVQQAIAMTNLPPTTASATTIATIPTTTYATSTLKSILQCDKNAKSWLGLASSDALERRGYTASASVAQLDPNIFWDPGANMTIRNSYLHSMLSATSMETDTMPDLESRTDLDSHDNMPVIGAGVLMIAETGKT